MYGLQEAKKRLFILKSGDCFLNHIKGTYSPTISNYYHYGDPSCAGQMVENQEMYNFRKHLSGVLVLNQEITIIHNCSS